MAFGTRCNAMRSTMTFRSEVADARPQSRLGVPIRKPSRPPASLRPSTKPSMSRSANAIARSRPGNTSVPRGLAASAYGKSNTTIWRSQRTTVVSSSRRRCGSSSRSPVRGHRGVMAAAAGFDLRTHRADGRQFGFSALDGRFRGHIDGCVVGGPAPMAFPALWETKALGAAPWKDVVKKGVVLARPSTPPKSRSIRPIWSCPIPPSSPR